MNKFLKKVSFIYMADTPWCGNDADKLYLQSGQFTSTLKTSEDVSGIDTGLVGISYNAIDTPWCGIQVDKLYLQSGQFTSTLKTSEDISGVDTPRSISWDEVNTSWIGFTDDKLYLTSGHFTSTIKDSVSITAIDITPQGSSYDGTDTPWIGMDADKLYLQSGQFTSTLKTSEDISSVETIPTGISWDAVNTPWCGNADDKLYLQSGQFTSTIKDSESIIGIDIAASDISTNNYEGRIGVYERSASNTITFGQSAVAVAIYSRSVSNTITFGQSAVAVAIYSRSVSNTITFGQNVVADKIRSIDTFFSGHVWDKFWLLSGQFSLTIKDSERVNTINNEVSGLSWDGTDTLWSGAWGTDDKLYRQSGKFTSILKDSEDVSGIDTHPTGISSDDSNTPWCGNTDFKLYLQSGKFTSTIKDSEDVSGIDAAPSGITYDGTNTPWCGSAGDKLYLQSGQFTSTIKDSESIIGIDSVCKGVDWDGINTPWVGDFANKLYLQSGQFTSTLKDSESVNSLDDVPTGISNINYYNRIGNQVYERSIESGLLITQEWVIAGGFREYNFEHMLTDDRIYWNPEIGEFYTVSYGLGHHVSLQVIGNRSVINDLNLSQEVEYIFIDASGYARSVSNTLSLGQSVADSRGFEHTLNLTQTVTAILCHSLSHDIYFGQTVSIVKILQRNFTDTIGLESTFTQIVNEDDRNVLCKYTPFVGSTTDAGAPTPPSLSAPSITPIDEITLSCAAKSTSIILRNPNLGDKNDLQFDRINQETRGGTLIIFADPDWPRIEKLILEFSALSETKAQELLTFLNVTLGQTITLTDWESNSWSGIITTPQNPIIRQIRNCGVSASIEFEGAPV